MVRKKKILIGALALVAVSAATWITVGNPLDPFDDRRFTPASWRAAAGPNHARRVPMVRGAIQAVPPGTPEARVVELLGESDGLLRGEDDGGNKLPGVRTHVWVLDSMVGGFDDAFFYVHIGSAGRVIGAEVNGY